MNLHQVQKSQQEPLRFLVFSASLRKNSLNTTLAKLAVEVIEKNGVKVDFTNISEFDCPSFNQDLEIDGIYPDGAEAFRKKLLDNNAFIIISPEYNGSMPGLLKNTIDWVSRFKPQPFNEHNALLMSASPSMVGGNRALWSLRMPLEHLGTRVFPNMFSLANAHKAFTPEGNLADVTLAKRFEDNLIAFMALVEASTHYPCMKKAWVEFLGEKPEAIIDRVE
ncbi:MAG TPA: NAD(P)H-dependent oxidoreductase [Saprospiraceae bacterium]|nr:NAD(P)H-dependent oxidoreductase [Saprospiraceae bacterium]